MKQFNKLTEQQIIKGLKEIGAGLTKEVIAYYINVAKYVAYDINANDHSKANLLQVYNEVIRYENFRKLMFKNNNILKALVVAKNTLK